MMVFYLILITLFFIGIGFGMKDYKALDLVIEINSLSTPYYSFGITFHGWENGDVEELTIGVVIVNISIVFYKRIL